MARRGAAGEVDADVEVQVLGEEVLEFAAFDDPQPVVAGGEGFGFRADPCCGDQDAGCGAFFFDGSGQGADVVGGDAFAVSLGLDQYLSLVHDVGLVVGDGVDALVPGGLGDVTSMPMASNSWRMRFSNLYQSIFSRSGRSRCLPARRRGRRSGTWPAGTR